MDWSRSKLNNALKFYRLSWQQRYLVAQASLLLPLAALALRWLGFRRFQSILITLSPLADEPVTDEAEVHRQAIATARAVRVAALHGPYGGNCLQRSLVLWWLLRRRNIEADLRFGVRKEAEEFQAHAWVELRGFALNEAGDVRQRFAAFDRSIIPVEMQSR